MIKMIRSITNGRKRSSWLTLHDDVNLFSLHDDINLFSLHDDKLIYINVFV